MRMFAVQSRWCHFSTPTIWWWRWRVYWDASSITASRAFFDFEQMPCRSSEKYSWSEYTTLVWFRTESEQLQQQNQRGYFNMCVAKFKHPVTLRPAYLMKSDSGEQLQYTQHQNHQPWGVYNTPSFVVMLLLYLKATRQISQPTGQFIVNFEKFSLLRNI